MNVWEGDRRFWVISEESKGASLWIWMHQRILKKRKIYESIDNSLSHESLGDTMV